MAAENPQKGRLIPYAIVAFFVVIILVNVVLVILAIDSHPGVETIEAYEKGRLYNQTLTLEKDGQALGWQASLGFEVAENGGFNLTITTLDNNGNPLNDLNITGVVVRPVRDGSDLSVVFEHIGNGQYGAHLDPPFPGQWDVRLLLVGPDNKTAQFIQRIILP